MLCSDAIMVHGEFENTAAYIEHCQTVAHMSKLARDAGAALKIALDQERERVAAEVIDAMVAGLDSLGLSHDDKQHAMRAGHARLNGESIPERIVVVEQATVVEIEPSNHSHHHAYRPDGSYGPVELTYVNSIGKE